MGSPPLGDVGGTTASRLLPIAGGVLIAAGGIGLYVLRRQSNA
ncbi:MAG: hypothetical protein KC413_23360 [Anaerolineales bacterium]|nr:hypothetical protein [Anaerolineales bacterium]